MWEEFDIAVNKMFRFANGKKVVLWGYERSGWFIEHLFRRSKKQIEYIVDDSYSMSYKLHISRSFTIESMDRDTTAVLLTFADDGKARDFLESIGYREGINFVFLRNIFYNDSMTRKLSYFDWLEYRYGADIIDAKGIGKIASPNADCRHYAAGIDYPLIDVLDNFSFSTEDAVFDYGCGKGNVLPLFKKMGVNRLGGVEYDSELYQTACDNFHKFGCNADGLLKGDAALIKEDLDDYNYFFIQNSFVGKTFDKVIQNIQESYERKRRKIILIYAGTFCHDNVLSNSNFKLSKTIDTDYWVRNVNIYMLNAL